MNSILKALPTLVMLLLAVLSLAVVVDAHDPVGLLGWLFCLAIGLTAGSPSPLTSQDSGGNPA